MKIYIGVTEEEASVLTRVGVGYELGLAKCQRGIFFCKTPRHALRFAILKALTTGNRSAPAVIELDVDEVNVQLSQVMNNIPIYVCPVPKIRKMKLIFPRTKGERERGLKYTSDVKYHKRDLGEVKFAI